MTKPFTYFLKYKQNSKIRKKNFGKGLLNVINFLKKPMKKIHGRDFAHKEYHSFGKYAKFT